MLTRGSWRPVLELHSADPRAEGAGSPPGVGLAFPPSVKGGDSEGPVAPGCTHSCFTRGCSPGGPGGEDGGEDTRGAGGGGSQPAEPVFLGLSWLLRQQMVGLEGVGPRATGLGPCKHSAASGVPGSWARDVPACAAPSKPQTWQLRTWWASDAFGYVAALTCGAMGLVGAAQGWCTHTHRGFHGTSRDMCTFSPSHHIPLPLPLPLLPLPPPPSPPPAPPPISPSPSSSSRSMA